MGGYVINWTAVGICLTALIAVWQLREQGKQKAADRSLETKRDILFDGVRAMAQAQQAFSNLANLDIQYQESSRLFIAALSQITVAASVASLKSAKAGKEFTDKIGPLFFVAMGMRARLDQIQGTSNPEFQPAFRQLAAFILDNALELSKSMLRAIAAVRTDVGIAKESESTFLAAVYPNEELVKDTIKKVLGK